MGTYGRHAGLFLKRKQTNKQTGLTEKKVKFLKEFSYQLNSDLASTKLAEPQSWDSNLVTS